MSPSKNTFHICLPQLWSKSKCNYPSTFALTQCHILDWPLAEKASDMKHIYFTIPIKHSAQQLHTNSYLWLSLGSRLKRGWAYYCAENFLWRPLSFLHFLSLQNTLTLLKEKLGKYSLVTLVLSTKTVLIWERIPWKLISIWGRTKEKTDNRLQFPGCS